MKERVPSIVLAVALVLFAGPPAPAAERAVAVTFDDLPGHPSGFLSNDISGLRENTRKLLAVFTEQRIPVVGFVNEGSSSSPERRRPTLRRAGRS